MVALTARSMVLPPRLSLPMLLVGLQLSSTSCSEQEALAPWSEDLKDGLSPSFDKNNLMSDDFFRASQAMDSDGLQFFFENSPYANRSWLADAKINGSLLSTLIVDVAQAHKINPLLLVSRMQTEASLVAKSLRPSQHTIDFALGCGCFDNQDCQDRFRGLEKQLACAASTLHEGFARSKEDGRVWSMGHTRKTLDDVHITPRNHATASLYAYTPWVLPERGGNWLSWSVTRKLEQHARLLDVLADQPSTPVAATWSRRDDGSYDLQATASDDVQRVLYFVDGIVIGEAERIDGDDFSAHRVFNVQGVNRPFEVRGYDDSGAWVAWSVGRLDVSGEEAVFVRQNILGRLEIGVERAGADFVAMEVFADSVSLSPASSEHLLQAPDLPAGPTRLTVQIYSTTDAHIPTRSYTRELILP